MDNRLHDLIVSIQNGDSAAFAEIEQLYEPLMTSLIRSVHTSDKYRDCAYMGIDDLRQEAVIALYSAACTYDLSDGRVTFGLYAKICIRNRLITVVRRNRADTAALEEDMVSADSDGCDPENAAIDEESFNALTELIDKSLTPFEKSVFNLYILGRTYEEIASALCKPRKSVDNAIYRIKVKIKRLI